MRDEQAIQVFAEHGWTLSARAARTLGLHWEDLYRLRDSGQLIELGRGVYRPTSAPSVEYLDLVAISARAPRATACLATALSYWDLTDDIPQTNHVAVPRGTHRPQFDWPLVSVHSFATDTYEFGRELVILSSGETFHVYDAARSIADAVRLGRRSGTDAPASLIKRYLAQRGNTPAQLLTTAKMMDCAGPVRALLEVITL